MSNNFNFYFALYAMAIHVIRTFFTPILIIFNQHVFTSYYTIRAVASRGARGIPPQSQQTILKCPNLRARLRVDILLYSFSKLKSQEMHFLANLGPFILKIFWESMPWDPPRRPKTFYSLFRGSENIFGSGTAPPQAQKPGYGPDYGLPLSKPGK